MCGPSVASKIAAGVGVLAGAAASAAAVEFYVAADGDDRWSGRLPAPDRVRADGPFASLTRARDAVRAWKEAGQLQGGATVWIREGTYRLREPLRLDGRDSGTVAGPVSYRAYQGERAILSGGIAVTGWTSYKGDILQCTVAELTKTPWRLRQLFFNGRRQVRARWPNLDPADALYGGWTYIEAVFPPNAKDVPPSSEPIRTFQADAALFTRDWANPDQGEIFVFPWLCWVNDIIPIQAVDRGKRTITLTRPASHTLMKGNRFRVENILEELDRPGEWCIDAETGTLYFWPPAGRLAGGEVTVPINDRLIELAGTADAPVEHIHIEGLTFTQTLSLSLVRGYAVQSDGFALYLENTRNCRIAGNLFDQTGGDAIRLQNANSHNEIVDNEIAEAGAQGICFYSTGKGNTHTWHESIDKLREMADRPTAAGNLISRNHIYRCGEIEKHGVGVFFFAINAHDNVISHNLIHDVPRYGIALQVGLGGNLIEYNDVQRSSLETADTGAIETNRWFVLAERPEFAKGNVIRFNRVLDAGGCGAYGVPREPLPDSSLRDGGRLWVPYYSWGIYFDNSPMDVTVYGNIIVGNVLGGVMVLGAGRNVLFENNILVDSSMSQIYYGSISSGGSYGPSADIRFLRNIVYYSSPNALLANVRGLPTKTVLAESDYNIYFNAGGSLLIDLPDVPPEETFSKWLSLGYDTHSVVADPGFVDAANGDYRLRPDSPAHELGFKPIPVERIGLTGTAP